MRWHRAKDLRFAQVPNILVIEDDLADRFQIKNVLGQSPMIGSEEIKFAATIQEAFDLAGVSGSRSAWVPTIILLDIHRPDGDGSTFLADRRKLEQAFPDARVHAISGLQEDDLPPDLLKQICEVCESFIWKWNLSTATIGLPGPRLPDLRPIPGGA